MTAALVLARLALSAVFAFAALGKLLDLDGSQRAVERFGVRGRMSRPVGLVLPVVELVLALALVPAQTARAAAVTSCGLLLVFCAAIARSVARRESHDCHCFGRLHSAPVAVTTLVRTGALTALAVVIAWRPTSQPGMTELTAVAAALVAAQAWLWLELLRRYGRALRRINEFEAGSPGLTPLEVGEAAPSFALPDLTAAVVALDSLLEESGDTILLFTAPGCSACKHVLRNVDAQRSSRVVAVAGGDADAVAATTAAHDVDVVLVDAERKVMRLYGVIAVPTAFLVDGDGLLARPPAVGAAEVGELMRTTPSLHLTGAAA